MDCTDSTPFLPKPTLKGKASRYSFAVTRCPTVHFLRRKLRRVTALFTRKKPDTTGVDYFTSRLPAEVRLRIYGHLLRFEAPLKRLPNGSRKAKARDLDILFVSRLVHREALQVLYELNIISVERGAFCTHVSQTAGARPLQNLNHDYMTSLYISSLDPSLACSALIIKATNGTSSTTLPTSLPCVYCDAPLLPLIRLLRDMPKLREVTVDYHGHWKAMKELAAALSRSQAQSIPELKLTCEGVGRHVLTGSWFAGKRVHFRDVLLSEVCTAIFGVPRATVSNLRFARRKAQAARKDMNETLTPHFGKKRVRVMARKISTTKMTQDQGMVSTAMPDMWSQDLEMDLRMVKGCNKEGFLWALDCEVQRLCE